MMRNQYELAQAKKKARGVSSFLRKTFDLLNNQQNEDVVRWAANGIGFIVLNQTLFSKVVLPKYFKHSNYSSFVRQLNMYNFHKVRENSTQSYFHHQCFDRANQEKLSQIKRKPEKKKRKNEESDEEIHSDNDEKENAKLAIIKQVEQNQKDVSSIKGETQPKISSQKNTNHFFSSEFNSERENPSLVRPFVVDEQSDDKISINNEISQRIIPRLGTRELFYPSNNNLFPFGGMMGQTSTFCLFF